SAPSASSCAARSCCRVFFFSSRRRHTRSKRDWSSDVCSSDLRDRLPSDDLQGRGRREGRDGRSRHHRPGGRALRADQNAAADDRSEERRVGKEWRSRWWPHQGKKNNDNEKTPKQKRNDKR